MTPIITFTAPGKPVAKGRPRFTRKGIAYTPKETVAYENFIKVCFLGATCGSTFLPLAEVYAVALVVRAYFAIPKSWPKWKRALAARGELPHVGRPDCDNVCKAVLDGLNTLAYQDDAQVCSILATKHYAVEPRVEVEIHYRRVPSKEDAKR